MSDMNKNNKKKLTVKEFCDKYNSLTNDKLKENLIDSVITRHYAPVIEKKVALEMNFKKSIIEKDGIKYIDSFIGQIGIMFAVLALYTNLDCEHTEANGMTDSNNFDDYDWLMETGIYPVLIYKIGEKDIKELMNIYSSIEETFMNQQTFEAYLASQVTRFGELIGRVSGSGIEALSKVLDDNNKMDLLKNTLTDVINKGKFNFVK